MKLKEHITVHKEQDHWYLQDKILNQQTLIDTQYHALVAILEAGVVSDEELLQRLENKLKEKEIIIDCMVAEFYLKYADFLQRNPEIELLIEL